MRTRREYRLWDKIRKVMITALDETPYEVEIYIDGSFSVNWRGEKFGEVHCWCEHSRDYDLMDYTGERDKDGTKIFEDDILECSSDMVYFGSGLKTGKISVTVDNVVFQDGLFRESKASDPLNKWGGMKYRRIVGNIHENPELLKG